MIVIEEIEIFCLEMLVKLRILVAYLKVKWSNWVKFLE